MTEDVLILAARRTAVAPRGGVFRNLQADELAAPVIEALLSDAGLGKDAVDHVIFGNALYGGGNPARMAALRAGLPEHIPAMTLDSQCCSGMDAILQACHLVRAGAARCVIAGGMESFSRSPIRMHRPLIAGEKPVEYTRPPFSPDPAMDPDMTEAAAALAAELSIPRESQAAYAVRSHEKAMAAWRAGELLEELVTVPGAVLDYDAFTRSLDFRTAMRAPVLAGDRATGVSVATAAVEADGGAAVIVAHPDLVTTAIARSSRVAPVIFRGGLTRGGSSAQPALVPVACLQELLQRLDLSVADIETYELMEAYAAQAMATSDLLGLPSDRINLGGGALSRGHPIGASGAILVVRLFQQLSGLASGISGIGLIAGVGGLGVCLCLGS
ncbi:thiolase family protein [Roseibium algae]|uniref:Thiolase family protein n=1 Tax=Roseibium algae TaxID=3123038 RepID=A0ABU8TRN2_9HYPH